MSFTYLASPYSDPDPDVRQRRFEAVCKAAADMMQTGETVYSAIAHGHAVETYGAEEPFGWDFWMEHCLDMLRKADKLVVLMLDGWKDSRGVAREIELATRRGVPIEYKGSAVSVYR